MKPSKKTLSMTPLFGPEHKVLNRTSPQWTSVYTLTLIMFRYCTSSRFSAHAHRRGFERPKAYSIPRVWHPAVWAVHRWQVCHWWPKWPPVSYCYRPDRHHLHFGWWWSRLAKTSQGLRVVSRDLALSRNGGSDSFELCLVSHFRFHILRIHDLHCPWSYASSQWSSWTAASATEYTRWRPRCWSRGIPRGWQVQWTLLSQNISTSRIYNIN